MSTALEGVACGFAGKEQWTLEQHGCELRRSTYTCIIFHRKYGGTTPSETGWIEEQSIWKKAGCKLYPPGFLTVWRVVPQPRVVQGPAVDSTASVLRGETNTNKKSQTRDFPGGPVAQGASLVAQTVENWPATWESWVQSLGWEAPLEEEMTTHSSILAWRIPCIEEPGGVWSRVVKSPTGLND